MGPGDGAVETWAETEQDVAGGRNGEGRAKEEADKGMWRTDGAGDEKGGSGEDWWCGGSGKGGGPEKGREVR